MTACLWHTPHPVELFSVQIIGALYLGTRVADTFLTFFKIIGIIATICIHGLVIKFQYDTAYPVKKETVVGNHEQRFVAAVEIAFQPLYHIKIEMVRRLVEYKQVRFCQQHVCQCNTFELSSAKFSDCLVQVAYFQTSKYLLCTQQGFVRPFMVKAGIKNGIVFIKFRRLFQKAHLKVATVYNLT